jgi:hypothetical protein
MRETLRGKLECLSVIADPSSNFVTACGVVNPKTRHSTEAFPGANWRDLIRVARIISGKAVVSKKLFCSEVRKGLTEF